MATTCRMGCQGRKSVCLNQVHFRVGIKLFFSLALWDSTNMFLGIFFCGWGFFFFVSSNWGLNKTYVRTVSFWLAMATIWYASNWLLPYFFGRLENHVFVGGQTLSPKHHQWIESHIALHCTHYITMFGGFGFLCGESCGKSPPYFLCSTPGM